MTSGGRNLTILGIGAICIAGLTTSTSLMMYRLSGDIYLDRSRPGYLPDKEEASETPEATTFVFPDSGALDRAELDQYLKELQKINERIDEFSDPYASGPLSDESLGITNSNTKE